MNVKITKAFRIKEGAGQRKYTPGEVAIGETATWAVENGFGEEIAAQDAGGAKAAEAPKNKAAAPVKTKADGGS